MSLYATSNTPQAFLSPESVIQRQNGEYIIPIKYVQLDDRLKERDEQKYISEVKEDKRLDVEKCFIRQIPDPHRADKEQCNSMKDYQPMQFIIRGDVRFKKKTYPKSLITVTPHYIFFSHCEGKNDDGNQSTTKKRQKNPKKDGEQNHEQQPRYIGDIHVLEIKKLLFGRNYELYNFLQIKLNPIQGKKIRATIYHPNKEAILKLTQLIYRNTQLAYSNAPHGIPRPLYDQSLKESESNEYFPEFREFITNKLSLSQCFQFSYAAICAIEDVPYNHNVVNYFHNQLIASTGFFNVNWVPFEAKETDIGRKLQELRPIFRSLIYSDYIKGIFCDHVNIPEIFKAVSYQLIRSPQVLFLHLVNVNDSRSPNEYLNELTDKIKENEQASVIYYDFSENIFKDRDIQKFFDIFDPNTVKKCYQSNFGVAVIYLGFNHCQFSKYMVEYLFSKINSSPPLQRLQYLHLAGSQWDYDTQRSFCDCLQSKFTQLPPSVGHTLRSLDLGDLHWMMENPKDSIDQMKQILRALQDQPLERLYLYNDTLFINRNEDNCFDELISLINKKPTFSTLDISNTGLLPEHVAEIVASMGSHHFYKLLTIKANKLEITGQGAKLVYSGFLKGNLDRWEKIFLDGNKMRQKDLQRFIPIFHQMNNLRELSISDNLSSSMQNVELDICELLTIQSLKILHICGSEDRKLGTKLNALFVAMALSYQLRKIIGGLAKYERTREQIEVFSPHMDDILTKLLADHVEDEEQREGYRKYVEEIRLEHISAAFLLQDKIEEMKNMPYKEMSEKIQNMFDLMKPLLYASTGEKYKETNFREKEAYIKRTNPIGYYSTHLMNTWSNKVLTTEYEKLDKIIKDLIGTGNPDDEKDMSQEWFRWAGKLAHLEELDIRNNEVGDEGIDCVIELIKLDTELKGIEIDGSAVTTAQSIFKVIDAVVDSDDDSNIQGLNEAGQSDEEKPEHSRITKMTFPRRDFKEIQRNLRNKSVKTILKEEKEIQQRRLVQAQNRHIFERKFEKTAYYREVPEYDFQEIPRISKVLNPEHKDQAQERELQKKLRIHSGISEDFSMQLPFLPVDNEIGYIGIPDNYMLQNDAIIEKMKVYEPCLDIASYKSTAKHSNALEKRFFEDEDLTIPDTEQVNVGPIQIDPNMFDEELSNDDELLANSDDLKDLADLNRLNLHVSDKSESMPEGSSEEESKNEENSEDRVIPDFDSADHEPETIDSMLYRRKRRKIDFEDEDDDEDNNVHTYADKTDELNYEFSMSKIRLGKSQIQRGDSYLEEPPR